MRTLKLALLLAALCACGGIDDAPSACKFTRPDPLPSVGIGDAGSSCHKTEYVVTASDGKLCGLDHNTPDCETVCGQPMLCTILNPTTVDCTSTVCGEVGDDAAVDD